MRRSKKWTAMQFDRHVCSDGGLTCLVEKHDGRWYWWVYLGSKTPMAENEVIGCDTCAEAKRDALAASARCHKSAAIADSVG